MTTRNRTRAARLAACVVVTPALVAGLGSGIAAAEQSSTPATTTPTPSSNTTSSTSTTTRSGRSGSAKDCDAVELVLVNGTTESSKSQGKYQDGGFFTAVASKATRGSSSVGRQYVPYDASFGGKFGDSSNATYEESMLGGVDSAEKQIKQIARKCDDTQVFIAGYSQGAQVASAVLRSIGAGEGPIDADRVAGGALLSDPTRQAGAPVFPGMPGKNSPEPAPGTDRDAVSQVQVADPAGADGSGIAPNTAADDFGALEGRVASFCVEGDLACATPTDSPLVHLVANIAGQTHMDDPVRGISDVAEALSMSAIGAAEHIAKTVDYDGDQFSMSPTSGTLLGRMAYYSNPINKDEGLEAGMGALSKIAGMGIGAGITVLKEVLAPDAIASYAAAGLANPAAAVPLVLARAGGAVIDMIPPATIDDAVDVAFHEIGQTLDDNTEVAELAMNTSLWETVTKHGSYDDQRVGADGETATELVTKWVLAAAEDLGGEVDTSATDGPSTGPGDELLGAVNDVSAADILDL